MDRVAGTLPITEGVAMFDRRHIACPSVDADRLKSQAADVGAKLSSASVRAGHTADVLAHQAKNAAEHAKEWASPRVEKAWVEGRKAAAPKVEEAAEKALPLVDRTHDRLVDDVLPKLVAAVNAAAAAAAVGADKARDVAAARLTELAHIPPPEPPKKSHTGARVFWSIAGLAVLGAVISAFRRNRPTTDPWAEDSWDSADVEPPLVKVREGLKDAADAVGEAAGEAVATARGTTEMIAEKAREVAHKTAKAAAEASEEPAAESDKAPEAPAAKPAAPRRSSTSRTTGAGTGTADKPASKAPRRTAAKPKDDAGTGEG
jgi:colicin import membrane protein